MTTATPSSSATERSSSTDADWRIQTLREAQAKYASPVIDAEKRAAEQAARDLLHQATGFDSLGPDGLDLLKKFDPVNHPEHYADGWSNGAEVIDITEHLSFNRGNVVKYVARAGVKHPARELEDLRKARWYLDREIARVEAW